MGWLDSIIQVLMRGESSEELSSLSGRTNYWEFAFQHISWFGGGLAVGSRSFILMEQNTFLHNSVNMHNSIVESLVGAGYIGAVPFILNFVFNIIRQLLNTVRRFDETDAIFSVLAVMFAARAMTSIVLAIFSFDFIMMLLFWAWIWISSHDFGENVPLPRPKPIVYEKTLHEQNLEHSS